MADPINVEQNGQFGEVPNIPAHNRSFYLAFFQMRRPVTAGELNHIQQIQRDALGRTAATFAQQGWAFYSDYTTNWQAIDAAGAQAAETTNLIMTLGRDSALVFDTAIEVGGNTGNGDLTIDLGTAPVSGVRKDLIILEIWNASVGGFGTDASDQDIYTNGRSGSGTEHNDILQSDIVNVETTRRIQTRYRIRVINDVSFFANPNGLASPSVTAQGENNTPIANYTFIDLGVTPTENGPAKRELSGLWRAGTNSIQSATDLGTTDGYVYALPMFISSRTASVSEPDITDIRQLTNGNLIGVFEFLAPCTLIVKALPILYYDCSKLFQQARLTHGSTPLNPTLVGDQMQGLFAARQLQSTAPGPFTNGPNDPGTPPFIVNSTTQVVNLNASYIQGAQPGTEAGNVLILDNDANAVVGGTSLSLSGNSGLDGLLQSVNLVNARGDLWLTNNALWDDTLRLFTPQPPPQEQTNPSNGLNFPSTGISIERLSAKISFNYADAGSPTITWTPTFVIDHKNTKSTLYTDFIVPTGKMGIGLGMAGVNPIPPSHALDIVGTATITANLTAPALIISASSSSDGIQITGQGANTKAVNASSVAGDAIYGSAATGNAGHFVGGTGFSVYSEGIKNAFMPATVGGTVYVGINNNNPLAELDVVGKVKTTNFQLLNGSAPPNGYYISATNNDGTAVWAKLPTGPIPTAFGIQYFLPIWGASNGLGDSSLYEAASGRISLGLGAVTSPTSLAMDTSLVVGYARTTAIPDSVSTTIDASHPLMSQGAVVFGSSSTAAAIFSNKAATNTTYSNVGGLSFMTLGNTQMVITQHGNVAIGVPTTGTGSLGTLPIDDTTAHARLEVNGGVGFGPGISGNARVDYPYITLITNASNNERVGIQFKKVGGVSTWSMGADTTTTTGVPSGNHNFYIKDSVASAGLGTRFLIDGSTAYAGVGVGIGNTTLAYAWHVIGDIGSNGKIVVNNNNTTGLNQVPSLVLNRDYPANDKNTSIVFQNTTVINTPITNFTLGTVDSSVTGAGAYNSVAWYLSDANGTRIYVDTYTKNMTINAAAVGTGVFNVASDNGVPLSGAASSTQFTVNGGTLGTSLGQQVILGSFGVQSVESGTHQVSLGILAYRTTAASTLDSTALGIGYSLDSTTNNNQSGIWFYNNGLVSIGETPSPTVHATNAKLSVGGAAKIGGSITATGFIYTTANIIGLGDGFNSNLTANGNPQLRLSAATKTAGNIRTSIGLFNGSVARWEFGNDLALNGGQNFFIYDSLQGATRFFIDNRGYVGINNSGSTTLRGELDVAGTTITNRIGIGNNAYPSDANNGSTAGVFSLVGPAIFQGLSPTPITVAIGMGGYGLQVTNYNALGVASSNISPFLVNATTVNAYAAVIQNNVAGGLYLASPIGQYALVVGTGTTSLNGPLGVAGATNLNNNVGISGGVEITGYDYSIGTNHYGLGVAENASFAKNVNVGATLIVGGQSGFIGAASFASNVTLYNGANLYVAGGNAIVRGTTSSIDLNVSGQAILSQSMQLKDGGGRLLALLGEYAGHNIKDYIYINPSNPHNVILRPTRFTGITIGTQWYEVLGDVVPINTLQGSGNGPFELCAFGVAPTPQPIPIPRPDPTGGTAAFYYVNAQQIGLVWRPMGYTHQYTLDHGYWSDGGESVYRVIANYWHTDTATSDLPLGGLVPFSKDTTDLDFVSSPSVGLRVREFYSNANNNGSLWGPGQQHFWVDEVAGTGFPIYQFYLTNPSFVQFNWTTWVGNTQTGGSDLALVWKLHLSSNGADWTNTATEIHPLTQYTVQQVGGAFPNHSTYMKYLPAGNHRIRQRVDATNQFGNDHSFNINLEVSELQLIFWAAEPNGYVSTYSPPPALSIPPVTPAPPNSVITLPSMPQNFTAQGVWTRSEECHWSPPADTGGGTVLYDIDWYDFSISTGGTATNLTGGGFQRDVVEDDHTQYRIRAHNQAGATAWSGWVDAYTWHTNVPNVPNNENNDRN